MIRIFGLLLILSLSSTQILTAQTQRFNAGIIAGLNLAELTGNSVSDYYAGWNVGIISTAKLSDHWQLGLEVLFSQNGEYILPKYYPKISYGQIRLNHVEIPVHLDFLTGIWKSDGYYNWKLHLGLAYARLLTHYAEDRYEIEVSDQLIYNNREVFLIQGGLTHQFNKKLGLNLRTSWPVTINGLDWTLAVRMIYMFL